MDQMNAAVPLPSQALRYDGKVGQLYGIFLLNILLTLVTLGIFRFWAMARVRRYLWSRLQFQGRRLEYTGTGGELFLGFLLAGLILLGVFLVTAALFYALSQVHPALSILPILGLYVVLITLGEAARFWPSAIASAGRSGAASGAGWRDRRSPMAPRCFSIGLRRC
jgi:uncharacterized membrane protein YjgN (DUF898 family)